MLVGKITVVRSWFVWKYDVWGLVCVQPSLQASIVNRVFSS